ncbi:hypothetical protein [Polyangium jinanense]|uniref:hypothetical protein n=1 Tax=Polyangium jinanense TaxID=2829994 RepID=UPI002341CF63|nr:hypothetical protein [Polyangium jinanense]
MGIRVGHLGFVLVAGLLGVGCVATEQPECSGDVACESEEQVGVSEEALVTWTAAISEETAPAYCPGNTVVTGVSCQGAYCDNVALLCETVSNAAHNYSWTTSFSEEGTYYRICPNGFVTGLKCNGGWCDNMYLECMTVYGSPLWPCYWGGAFSEENPPAIVPAGYAVAGMACSGSYCDNISLYYCKL